MIWFVILVFLKKSILKKRLDIISEPEMTIFKEDLKDEISLGSKIANVI